MFLTEARNDMTKTMSRPAGVCITKGFAMDVSKIKPWTLKSG